MERGEAELRTTSGRRALAERVASVDSKRRCGRFLMSLQAGFNNTFRGTDQLGVGFHGVSG